MRRIHTFVYHLHNTILASLNNAVIRKIHIFSAAPCCKNISVLARHVLVEPSGAITTRLSYGQSWVRISRGARDFSLFKKVQTYSGAYSLATKLFNWHASSIPPVKWPEREVYHSRLSNIEVKNEWSCISTPTSIKAFIT